MTLNRLYLICIATLAAVWVWLYAVDIAERAADRSMYEQTVVPALQSRDAAASRRAINKELERTHRRISNSSMRMNVFFGALALTWVWTVTNFVRTEAAWKKRNSPTRPADASAGEVVREIQRQEKVLLARTRKGLRLLPFKEQMIEVNFPSRTVTFRNFRFVTSFFAPTLRPELTLPFTEILGGRVWVNHGHAMAQLRTTAGKVAIRDALQPFQSLVAVLFDIAEANRKDPVAFAAALSREPKIRTPWYGWLFAALGFVAVAALSVLLWRVT